MTLLESLMKARFPNGEVYRLAHVDKWRVQLDIDACDVVTSRADPDPFCRKVIGALTPTKRVKRRLHYGRKH